MEVINLKGRNQEEVYKAIAAGELSYIGDHQNQGGWKLKRAKWYNPYKVDKPGKKRDGTRAEVIEKYRNHILNNQELLSALPELKGKMLGCWCKPLACHGDILIELLEGKQRPVIAAQEYPSDEAGRLLSDHSALQVK